MHERTLAFGGTALVAAVVGLLRWNADRTLRLNQAVCALGLGAGALGLGIYQYNEFQDAVGQIDRSLEELQRFTP